MSARGQLNTVWFGVCLGMATLVGLAAQSWWVFAGGLVVGTVLAAGNGNIRTARPSRRARP